MKEISMFKSIKTATLIILVLGSFLKMSSQSPGYMGKKLVAGYGFYFHPAIANALYNYSDRNLTTVHEFFLEYTSGKKFMLGTSARLYRYTYNNVAGVTAEDSPSAANATQLDDSPQGTYVMKGRNYTLYVKCFRSKYLAPWGKYFMMGMTFNSYLAIHDPEVMKVEFERDTYTNGSYDPQKFYVSEFGVTTQEYKGIDLMFGQGRSRIFADKFVLDYGYNLNLFAMARILGYVFDDGSYYNSKDYIEKTSRNREAAVNRFNLFIKIGYLF